MKPRSAIKTDLFADEHHRKKIDSLGDPLIDIESHIDFAALAAEVGLTIVSVGPDFGSEALLDTVADSASLATLVAEGIRLVWPQGHDLRRIPLTDPTPVYPHSLVWDAANTHPGLAALRAHLAERPLARPSSRAWTPAWAVRGAFPARRP